MTIGLRSWVPIAGAMALGIPGLLLRAVGSELPHEAPLLGALVFGMGIVGAAFLLSWAAEAAQKDVSGALAIAVLALIALLPEYAVESLLAWDAGAHLGDHTVAARVAANVTGANRLLIGLGWSAVMLIFWLHTRRGIALEHRLRLELTMLTLATLVTFLIFFMKEVALILAGILLLLYVVYLVGSSLAERHEPELEGPAEAIGSLPRAQRRLMVLLLLAYSAGVIVAAVHPFVVSLVTAGSRFGIDEFLLIQWVAPVASESPEMLVAILYAARANPFMGLSVLVSAEVNQLTVLIGSMPFVYSASAGHVISFPLEHRTATEFLLTSSFSLFAVLLLARGRLGWQVALVLLGVFAGHLLFPGVDARRLFTFLCLGLSAVLVVRHPTTLTGLAQTVWGQVAGLRGWFARPRPPSDMPTR